MSIFDDEYAEIFGNTTIKTTIEKLIENNSCKHEEFFLKDGAQICRLCGFVSDILDFEAEWRFYGPSDNRSIRDPSRCHRSRETNRGGIDKVFTDCKIQLPMATKSRVEKKYQQIVGGDTVRGKGRKAIVAACLMHDFRDCGDVRTSDEIREMFGLSKQEMADGVTRYQETFPEYRTQHIRPADLILRVMNLTGVHTSHYQKIFQIAKCLEGVDQVLNHSSPQSVASAIVYFYLCLFPDVKKELGMTKAKFSSLAKLSDITISKLVKRAAQVLEEEISV